MFSLGGRAAGLPFGIMKPLVIRSAVVASLGGLIFGFDTAVISGAEKQIQEQFGLSDGMLGFTVTTALIGTIIGAVVTGRPADRYGRKKVLYTIGALYVISAIGCAVAPTSSVELLQLFRFIGGLGVGASSVCAPIYTAEISPPKHRGRLVGLVQFNIVLGILVAYASNAIIRGVMGDDPNAWRWMLGVMVVPAAVFLLLLPTVPETPRWLAGHDDVARARAISERLCSTQADADEQMAEIQQSLAAESGRAKSRFYTRGHRKVILLAVAIAFFNQLSGINAILYYAPRVMEDAGATGNAPYLMSIAVGFVNLIATMAALTVIDRLGRRRLMLVGSVGYLVSLGFLAGVMFVYDGDYDGTSAALVLLGLVVFIASHAFGQGAVIWVFISEIFPNRIRGQGQSLGSTTHWVFAAITSFAFPPILGALGGGFAFSIFFCFMVLQLLWVLKVMPETKGIPLEEMTERLGLDSDPDDGVPDPLAAKGH